MHGSKALKYPAIRSRLPAVMPFHFSEAAWNCPTDATAASRTFHVDSALDSIPASACTLLLHNLPLSQILAISRYVRPTVLARCLFRSCASNKASVTEASKGCPRRPSVILRLEGSLPSHLCDTIILTFCTKAGILDA